MLLRALIENLDKDEQRETLSYLKENLGERHFPLLPPDFLSSMCEVEDRKPQLSRLSEDTDYIHVSSLLDLCPRQYALAKQHNLKLSEKVGPAQRIVWEMGKALEAHAIRNIQNYHGENLVQKGEVITDEDYLIQGAPDIIVDIGENQSVIVEIKTMNARDFDKLEEPRGDHILQAAMYQWLAEHNLFGKGLCSSIHDHVIILYICKDFIRNKSPYKEFQVDINQEFIRNGVDIALQLALELKTAKENNKIPRRHVCSREDCARARACPVQKMCWENPEEEYVIE